MSDLQFGNCGWISGIEPNNSGWSRFTIVSSLVTDLTQLRYMSFQLHVKKEEGRSKQQEGLLSGGWVLILREQGTMETSVHTLKFNFAFFLVSKTKRETPTPTPQEIFGVPWTNH